MNNSKVEENYPHLINPGPVIACCTTPFQIMMVVLLKITVYKNNQMDLLVTEHTKGHQKLVNNASKTGLFRNVSVYKNGEVDGLYNKEKYNTKFKRLMRVMHRHDYVKPFVSAHDYATLLVSDAIPSLNYLYDYLKTKINNNIQLVFFDDGAIATVVDQQKEFCRPLASDSNFIQRLVHRYNKIPGNFAYGFTGVKELLECHPNFPMFNLPDLETEKEEYLRVINQIWNYRKENLFSQKYIFFEESFFQDGIDSKDFDAIEDIANLVGKNNIIVKLHPRTQINRFEKVGILTNKDTSVPWELIVLNNEEIINKKVLITFASSSTLTSQIYWKIKQNTIALADCKDYYFEALEKPYYKKYIEVSEKSGLQYVPKSKAELLSILKNFN